MYVEYVGNANHIPNQAIQGSQGDSKDTRETPGIPGELQGSQGGAASIPGKLQGYQSGSMDPTGTPGDPGETPATRDPRRTPANDGLYRNNDYRRWLCI